MAARATGESALAMIFDESMLNASVRIKLSNSGATSKRIAVFPGALTTADAIAKVTGLQVDAIAKEDEVTTDVTCVCPNLAFIHDEFAHNPQRISGIQLQTDNEAQFFEPIEVAEYNATRNFGADEIKPSQYLDPANSNKTLVLINDLKHFQLDRNHIMVVTLAPGRSLDISLTLGARFSAGQLLQDAACAVIGC
jgi:peroxiredoxin